MASGCQPRKSAGHHEGQPGGNVWGLGPGFWRWSAGRGAGFAGQQPLSHPRCSGDDRHSRRQPGADGLALACPAPAKPDGVAASLGRPEDNTLYTALFLGLAVAVVTIAPVTSFHPLAVMLVASGAAAFASNRLVSHRLGGQTGDTIGATQQICEITALASIAMAL